MDRVSVWRSGGKRWWHGVIIWVEDRRMEACLRAWRLWFPYVWEKELLWDAYALNFLVPWAVSTSVVWENCSVYCRLLIYRKAWKHTLELFNLASLVFIAFLIHGLASEIFDMLIFNTCIFQFCWQSRISQMIVKTPGYFENAIMSPTVSTFILEIRGISKKLW